MDNQVKIPAKDMDKFLLRLPDGMRTQIANSAAHNLRSFNSEILYRLMRAYKLEPSND